SAPEVVTVEVTRVVTETVEIEGETVEVTVVVVETVTEEVEVPAAEEPAAEAPIMEEAEEEALEEAIGDDMSAIGSEDATGDGPPPPDTGPKVESDRTETSSTESAVEAEVRSADSDGETAVAEAPLSTSAEDPIVVDLALDQGSRLTAGEVDDNAQWDDYLLYLRNYIGASVMRVDVSERHQILVTDSQGNPVLGARIGVEANGEEVMVLRTYSNGRTLFFPRALNPDQQAQLYNLKITVNGLTETFDISADSSQREWTIVHPGADQLPTSVNLDVMFLIDATGSMSDEINQLKENIRAIAAQADALPSQPNVRFGMVTYRDREDAYLTEVTDFTPDVESFANALALVRAEGGGDYPEDLNEALFQSIHQTEWRIENTVSLIFLVADAPPHLDYGQQNHYAVEMLEAMERGIKIYPIASSGLDSQGEYVFRQLAQVTNGRFIFLTYGEEGAGSTGTETNFNVSDYTVSSLDQMVINIIEEELSHRIR
ncbi:MAG: VWA domain-containing protein, partial [Chloroflexi bacterium]